MLSLADHIDVTFRDIDPSLISGENLENIKRLAQELPYDITRDHGFESHLWEEEPRADYLFCVKRNSFGVKLLAGKNHQPFVPSILTGKPTWGRINDFAREWDEPDGFFHHHINSIWFEYDHQSRGLAQIPKFFLGIDLPGTQEDTFLFTSELFQEISGTFFGHSTDNGVLETAAKCLSALPGGSRLYHTGFYLNEHLSSLRLVLVGLQPERLMTYLSNINWTGDISKIEMLLYDLKGRSDYLVFDIDIGPAVLPTLGIEMYFSDFRQSSLEPRWRSNLEWMVQKGWCTPEKMEGLLRYTGRHLVTHFYRLNYLNSLNHLKIVYKNSDIMGVKAYFGTYIIEKH
jgi:hypothetical protein